MNDHHVVIAFTVFGPAVFARDTRFLTDQTVSGISHWAGGRHTASDTFLLFPTLGVVTVVTVIDIRLIFEALRQITVEKVELIHAIQLIRMSREYGPSIDERWTTATQNAVELDRAYNKGLQDGIDKEHARVMAALNKMEDKYEQNN